MDSVLFNESRRFTEKILNMTLCSKLKRLNALQWRLQLKIYCRCGRLFLDIYTLNSFDLIERLVYNRYEHTKDLLEVKVFSLPDLIKDAVIALRVDSLVVEKKRIPTTLY